MGQRDLHTKTSCLLDIMGHCLLTEVEVQVVLPTVPGLVLAGEEAVKRGSLVVPDFGLDIFCHVADS